MPNTCVQEHQHTYVHNYKHKYTHTYLYACIYTYSQIESTTNHSATFNQVQHVCNPVHSQNLHIASLKQDKANTISNNTNL